MILVDARHLINAESNKLYKYLPGNPGYYVHKRIEIRRNDRLSNSINLLYVLTGCAFDGNKARALKKSHESQMYSY